MIGNVSWPDKLILLGYLGSFLSLNKPTCPWMRLADTWWDMCCWNTLHPQRVCLSKGRFEGSQDFTRMLFWMPQMMADDGGWCTMSDDNFEVIKKSTGPTWSRSDDIWWHMMTQCPHSDTHTHTTVLSKFSNESAILPWSHARPA